MQRSPFMMARWALRLALAVLVLGCGGRETPPRIGYDVDPHAEQKKTLLLRDFEPRPMLHVPAHEVARARYPVIDFHNHVDDGKIMPEHVDPASAVRIMDECNVRTVVVLTGGWGARFARIRSELVEAHPKRFLVFAEIDYAHIDEPGYLVKELRESVAAGARGLKVLKDLGLEVRDRSGKLLAIDDARLDPVWAEAGRLGIPVAIHTADPDAFFTPLDRHNERYDELVNHPDWHFYGHGVPDKRALLEARNRVIARHPGTTFVGLHVANHPEDLAEVSAWLDQYPNLYVETGARQAELGRQPRVARAFMLKYQDRILFGSDMPPDRAMYRSWWRTLETDDDAFDYYGAPGQGRWKIYGLALPDEVLAKIYSGNAARLLRIDPGELTKGPSETPR
jgi:predicted TIM-barrel fold metal-dependent hydrolase